ncbi:glycoside hydrolase family 88 protein [Pelagicoccus sp. NFK12]|uniref:Glycoside hydrolase family 88 protein n=1 Tax=Pelagicoccus enzymogenes TaxID=2773457 RepID=A0A927F508_9BACT|nr:glycoside hydrolase family 88 protein [Pelagicoccus enzymogenes]MBD5778562.1 glycoside hydrolase family 88 protein [Pelagicoccus enzymogenes]MDQ8197077.1 glycoside hydrolase family 88 protein [Pelagicoccus enzymogenes]
MKIEKLAKRSIGGAAAMAVAALFAVGCSPSSEENEAAAVEAEVRRVADWILDNPSGRDTRHWVIAPLYDGLLRAAHATGDERYLATVVELGEQSVWLPGPRRYHADDHAVGHAWLDIYFMDSERKERLNPFVERFEEIFAEPRLEELDYRDKKKYPDVDVSDRWTWCDALYMAPPTLARLHAATGDERYLEFLEREFTFTYEELYDEEEKLFFRDTRFLDRRTENGKKIFWSRGNGWVYGGLALTLEYLPESYAYRTFLEELFVEMTEGVLQAQQEDGLWRPSLRDPEQIAVGETSGSGFFAFGLAWGINNGYLDRETYLPRLEAAWEGLLTRVEESGRVGYVQRIGSAPDTLTAKETEDYGVGAVLLAGAEYLRVLGESEQALSGELLGKAEALLAKDEGKPRGFARLVPERKDDIAFENDVVAFRVYGPALRDSQERSGVDAWTKKVDYPIINKWYEGDLKHGKSYHQDTGEGFDGYKVGPTVGAGGTGLWVNGSLLQANVYDRGFVNWSARDTASITVEYEYPETEYGKVTEKKTITLHLGDRYYEAVSRFYYTGTWNLVKDLPVAVGLVAQSEKPEIWTDEENASVGIWDAFHGGALGTAVQLVDKESFTAFASADAGQELIVGKTDENGEFRFRSGFGWTGEVELADFEAWKKLWETSQ